MNNKMYNLNLKRCDKVLTDYERELDTEKFIGNVKFNLGFHLGRDTKINQNAFIESCYIKGITVKVAIDATLKKMGINPMSTSMIAGYRKKRFERKLTLTA